MAIDEGPWAPFEPTDKDSWDADKVAHLHRRAGFGATRSELARDMKEGVKASVQRFLEPRALSAAAQSTLEGLRKGVVKTNNVERLKAWWLYRILYDSDPLREKMTLFWHSHFATGNDKVGSVLLMLAQNESLRQHALGRFGEMLEVVIADPAMLLWLDGFVNTKAKPNENFGREFLELFTLGVGNYTEADVRAAARALTGWSIADLNRAYAGSPDTDARGVFNEDAHDSGEKTFLKSKGTWKHSDIVRITLEQPACAEFLCRKLYRYLVREDEDPSAELLSPLARELRGHAYNVHHVVGIILRSRHFYAPEVRRQRIKSPVEWSASFLRMLEVPRADVNLLALAVACAHQGQDLFYPPNVKGWDGGKSWLNSTTVLERGNWCNDVIWGNDDFGLKPYDPLAWASRHAIAPEQAAQAILDLFFQNDDGARGRDAVVRTGRDGKADSLRKALQLIVHCPEYQLA
jgi:uncharacterized protein (DUF1800 family)